MVMQVITSKDKNNYMQKKSGGEGKEERGKAETEVGW